MTEAILFALFSFAAIFFAFNVIFRRNAVHSALHLVGVLLSLSGLFVLLNAQFIAAIQILVYAGAIMVLFLFVVMLLNVPREEPAPPSVSALLGPTGMRLGALLSLLLGAEILWALADMGIRRPESTASVSSVALIGSGIFLRHAFAFEATSVLILVAMIGAVVLARREPS